MQIDSAGISDYFSPLYWLHCYSNNLHFVVNVT